MPIFLQVVTGASATASGLLLLPLLLAATASTAISGRLISRTGRYKAFPVAGLALMAVGLLLLAQLDAAHARAPPAALVLVVFGARLRDGVAGPDGRDPERRRAPRPGHRDRRRRTSFRSLGGSVGVAVFGAIFAGRLDRQPGRVAGLDAAAVADALQPVFLVAAPFALAGFLVVLLLRETPVATASAATGAAR